MVDTDFLLKGGIIIIKKQKKFQHTVPNRGRGAVKITNDLKLKTTSKMKMTTKIKTTSKMKTLSKMRMN